MEQAHEPSRAFLVTGVLNAPSAAELTSVGRALMIACRRLDASGTPVHLIGTAYLPAQQRWLGLVLADHSDVASRAAAVAQLVAPRVVEL